MLRCLEPGWRETQAADTKVGAEPGAFKSVETDELMGTGTGRGVCVTDQVPGLCPQKPQHFGPHRKEQWQAAGTEKSGVSVRWFSGENGRPALRKLNSLRHTHCILQTGGSW